jgi:amino acid transporter
MARLSISGGAGLTKRLLVGRALRSDRLGETLLPKRIALPVFASDPLSSVAYAPEEMLLMLSIAGVAAYSYSTYITMAIIFLMVTVVMSYRQNVHAYPSGGGDYEVANTNLGKGAGLTVASALLVDYVLTVAVSVSAGVANAASALPAIAEHKVAFAVGIIALLTFMNLRGIKESGRAFAIPTYGFIVGVLGMIGYGFYQVLTGVELKAESADFTLLPHDEFTGIALVFLLLRAFSSGSAALTGVEAISNGVPAFRHPKSKNAATTLAIMGTIALTMFVGLLSLARLSGVQVAENPAEDFLGAPAGYQQKTLLAQVAQAVFAGFPIGFLYVALVTAFILFLAANTAYSGFPVLGSILARDGFLPRQLHTRGDRLAFSNGIIALAAVATLLVIVFDADVTKLIHLYIIGVFVSFTTSQTGMVRHWTRLLKIEADPQARRRMVRSRIINTIGMLVCGFVLVIVLITKFMIGAWIVVVAMPVLIVLMAGISRHYRAVSAELAVDDDETVTLPSRTHAVVLVSKIHKPTLRALAYARATRPSTLEAVTVDVDREDTERFMAEWDRREIPVPLRVLASPYREITKPVVDYVRSIRRESPRDIVTVFVPEYVLGHWWEQFLHNQSALRIKTRLLFTPGVMVTSVPWQLASSEQVRIEEDPQRTTTYRWGDDH